MLPRALLLTAVLLLPLGLSAQVRFRGIPPSVSSPVPIRPNGGFAIGGQIGFAPHGFIRFGHNPRFRVFVGKDFRFRRFHSPFFSPGVFPVPVYVGGGYPFVDGGYPLMVQDESAAGQAAVNQNLALLPELDRLRDEVEELRDELRERERPRATAPEPQAARPAAPEVPVRAAVLVLRDGRRLETFNYAVVGDTIWVLDEHRARRFAVSDLDLDATIQANEERGIEFRLPGRHS